MKPVALFLFLISLLITDFILSLLQRNVAPWLLWLIPVCCISVVLLLWRSVILPSRIADRGMAILSSQDFNNRLVKPGEKNADTVVALFNSLIDRLRQERLQNIEREGFLHLLLEASPVGIVTLDDNFKIIEINPAFYKLTNIPSDISLIGKNMREVDSPLVKDILEIATGESGLIACGDRRRLKCHNLSFIKEGYPHRFFLIENLTEEMLKAQRKAYDKLVRIISHEVNNTMGGINTVLESLIENENDAEIKEIACGCLERSLQMCSFVSSYAEVVKVPKPLIREINLVEEIGKMIPFLKTLTNEETELRFIGPEKVIIKADLVLLQQALVNIVKNAVESIKGPGWVQIEVSREGKKIMMEVSNNGVPISKEVEKELFSPFFTTKSEGRGIGLTLIAEILDLHGFSYSLKTGGDMITRFRIQSS